MFYECAHCEKSGCCIGCELKPNYDGAWHPSKYIPDHYSASDSTDIAMNPTDKAKGGAPC